MADYGDGVVATVVVITVVVTVDIAVADNTDGDTVVVDVDR